MSNSMRKMGALLLAVLLLACNPDRSVKPPPDPVKEQWGIMPLRAGNRWHYEAYDLKRQTGEIESRYVSGDRRTGVDRDTVVTLDGQTYNAFIWTLFNLATGEPAPYQWLLCNDHEGLWCLGAVAPNDTLMGKIPWLKYPIKKGESFEVPCLAYHLLDLKWEYADTARYTCIDDAVWFHTEKDSFLSVAYQHTFEEDGGDYYISWEKIQYFAPNVGEVGTLTINFSTDRYAPDTTRLNSANWAGKYKFKNMLSDYIILNGE